MGKKELGWMAAWKGPLLVTLALALFYLVLLWGNWRAYWALLGITAWFLFVGVVCMSLLSAAYERRGVPQYRWRFLQRQALLGRWIAAKGAPVLTYVLVILILPGIVLWILFG
jgi:hypothetical protein